MSLCLAFEKRDRETRRMGARAKMQAFSHDVRVLRGFAAFPSLFSCADQREVSSTRRKRAKPAKKAHEAWASVLRNRRLWQPSLELDRGTEAEHEHEHGPSVLCSLGIADMCAREG